MTVARYLPDDQVRCSAYWYAQRAGLLTGNWPEDLEFLRVLGWRAAGLARYHRLPAWKAPEGEFFVYMHPEWVWEQTIRQMRAECWAAGAYG